MSTTEAPAPVKPKTRTLYVVLKDARPTTLAAKTACPIDTRRVLVKASGEDPLALFATEKLAQKAIGRTANIASKLNASVCFDWPKLRPITEAGEWSVTTLHRWKKKNTISA